ncbi:GAF domain-containing sensor histidine kinase [Bacteriovorax sp. Seq25_V]|uniref:GAF domain-containing sensor histidine kinase n=1 Tax=Bacteriovorax sp. Seq25_V TaxID=1201288 RepID=UPI00038A4E15|nr:GAF domain-containing sensor histidine kinase [Bacteriovorax sp. Seq25_V]EQC44191.1 GHKL domain protein [Bacteriovorax sp. Seq25_V]
MVTNNKSGDTRLLEIVRNINFTKLSELQSCLDQITNEVSKYLAADRVGIWLHGEKRDCIYAPSLYLKDGNSHQRDIYLYKKDYPSYFEALERDRIIEAQDARAHEATKCFKESYLEPLGIFSLYDTPIWDSDEVIGVLCLEYTTAKENWSITEKNFMTSIADFIGKLFEKKSFLELIETLEDKVAQRTRELTEAKDIIVAQEKLASLGALTAGVAHEIRNPLNLISNAAKILESMTDSEESFAEAEFEDFQTTIEIILTSSKRAESIIKSMLEQSRNDDTFEIESFNEMINEAVKLSYHAMRAKAMVDVTPHVHLCDVPDFYMSRISLQRAIINLLDNSFYALKAKKDKDEKFMPELELTSQIDEQNNQLVLRIYDNGDGVEKEQIKKILEPFYTTKPTGQGTGLGLSMVFDIIKRHGGNLHVNSAPGEYFESIIRLPLRKD